MEENNKKNNKELNNGTDKKVVAKNEEDAKLSKIVEENGKKEKRTKLEQEHDREEAEKGIIRVRNIIEKFFGNLENAGMEPSVLNGLKADAKDKGVADFKRAIDENKGLGTIAINEMANSSAKFAIKETIKGSKEVYAVVESSSIETTVSKQIIDEKLSKGFQTEKSETKKVLDKNTIEDIFKNMGKINFKDNSSNKNYLSDRREKIARMKAMNEIVEAAKLNPPKTTQEWLNQALSMVELGTRNCKNADILLEKLFENEKIDIPFIIDSDGKKVLDRNACSKILSDIAHTHRIPFEESREDAKKYINDEIDKKIEIESRRQSLEAGINFRTAEEQYIFDIMERFKTFEELGEGGAAQLAYYAYQIGILAKEGSEEAKAHLEFIFDKMEEENVPWEVDENGNKNVPIEYLQQLLISKYKEFGIEGDSKSFLEEAESDLRRNAGSVEDRGNDKKIKQALKKIIDINCQKRKKDFNDTDKYKIIYSMTKLKILADNGIEDAKTLLLNMNIALKLGLPVVTKNGKKELDSETFESILEMVGERLNIDDIESIKEDAERDLLYEDEITLKNIREENKRKVDDRVVPEDERDEIVQQFSVERDNESLTQEQIDEMLKSQGLGIFAQESDEKQEDVSLETLFKEDVKSKDFDKKIEEVVSGDLTGAYEFLKDALDSDSPKDIGKIKVLQETINQVAEKKMREEVLGPAPENPAEDFKTRMDKIVSTINPDLAQDVMKRILDEGHTNDEIGNFDNRVLSMQESVKEAFASRDHSQTKDNRETKKVEPEKIDVKDNSSALKQDKTAKDLEEAQVDIEEDAR